jgi:hypothetical protein
MPTEPHRTAPEGGGRRRGHAAAQSRTSRPQADVVSAPTAVTSLVDPRALQILATEHYDLLSARSLAYNEVFTRVGMFLTFLSTSLVALALIAQPMAFGRDFLVIAAIVLGFDFVIGLATVGRIVGANNDDFRANQGMARIRHGYTQIAPIVEPYFVSGTHDDVAGVMAAYGRPPEGIARGVLYALTTSLGMTTLIVALIGGVIALVLSLVLGAAGSLGFGLGGVVTVVTFLAIWAVIPRSFANLNERERFPTLFPSPAAGDRQE